MADMDALRDRIDELAMNPNRPGHRSMTVNRLYDLLVAECGGIAPVGRGNFYRWFGQERARPSAMLLECVPGFAKILGVETYELYAAAELLPPELDLSMSLMDAARRMRNASYDATRAITSARLATSGESIVADRILHAKLDYQISIWPVVRGHVRPLHLHSLIALRPLEPGHSKRRNRTAEIEAMPLRARRNHLRYEVIGDRHWRQLGLMWREEDVEWNLGRVPLTIEMPIEERNRIADDVPPGLTARRILVLGLPWGHAELMAALLAGALHFGSLDLRYQGFSLEDERAELMRFCIDRLRESRDHLVWAIAQRSDVMAELAPEIVKCSRDSLVVVVSYGQRMRAAAARVFGTRVAYIDRAQRELDQVSVELNRNGPLIRAHLDDADVGDRAVDRNLVADAVRLLTAQVLNLIYDHRCGPPAERWGGRFPDVLDGSRHRARIPGSTSSARWVDQGELSLG